VLLSRASAPKLAARRRMRTGRASDKPPSSLALPSFPSSTPRGPSDSGGSQKSQRRVRRSR
jgi:hypothetical protein